MSSKLNVKIHTLLVQNELDNFSLLDLRRAYSAEFPEDALSPNEIRKFIYRQLYRLVKKGLLIKDGKQNSQKIIYTKTQKFVEQYHAENRVAETSKESKTSADDIDQKLIACRVDLSAAIAESEEYQLFAKNNPDFRTSVFPQLQNSRERSAKLLGQVKALENIKMLLSGASNEA